MFGSRRSAAVISIVLVAAFAPAGLMSCASLGGGDAVVVRAEDALVNSLVLYRSAMEYHMKNSKTESEDVYRAMEILRRGFPPVWRTLNAAVPAYKATKSAADKKSLEDALAALEVFTRELRNVWGRTL